MDQKEHRDHHEKLHKAFDQLLADFLAHNPGALPSKTTVIELIQWSYQQTLDLTHADGADGAITQTPRRTE